MANFNLNKVILGGRMCVNPELKRTPSDVAVTNFPIAVNRKYAVKDEAGQEQRQADFISVVAWRQTAEFVCRYFQKGSSICVVGSIQTRTWTDKEGEKHYVTEVLADEVYFVDSKGEGGGNRPPMPTDAPPERGGGSYMPESYTASGAAPKFEVLDGDDELPF